jgi:type IV secretion system protein VirB11
MRIINSLASVSDTPIDKWERPTLESIIPRYNIRTTAIIPPWVESPEITFRRPADKVFTLEEYLQQGRMSAELYDKIVAHIEKRSNIVISGSTGSGKTTFTNACIEKMREFTPDERFYIVEDTPELQCRSTNKTQLYIRKEQAVAAIQTALRWTPKRIIFGELRSAR